MMSGGRGGRVGGWGQKVLSKPSADSFAVGRRQKWGYNFENLVLKDKNSETGRRRRRRFVVPRPGTTLSHLVKIISKS
jgi:hypothetical protein